MYRFRNDIEVRVNKSKASEEIGIDRSYMSMILNKRRNCSKLVAYCITKYLDQDAEIKDYFILTI